METRVSGHQVDTGESLQSHATDRLEAIVEKHFSRALSSHVTIGRAPAGAFDCDIVMHVQQGLVLKSHGEAQDAHQAFDKAATKLEKQLRRYRRRLKDRHEQAQHAMREEDAAYTIFALPPPADESDGEDEAPDAPPIIAETRATVPEVSVSDAVMMLDLRDTDALLFKNAGTGSHNMVYRRRDGSIGWVEPS